MDLRLLHSIFIVLLSVFQLSNSCTRIEISGGENSGVEWINGIFEMDNKLKIDDRLTYKEINGSRVIYHYSGDVNSREREPGKWLLGSTQTIGSDSGWAYRMSWSISPDDMTVASVHNNEESPFPWRIYVGDEWVELEQLAFRCLSAFGDYDPMNDLIFITTDNDFEDHELTYQAIHGFYIRVSLNTFMKINGPHRLFYQEKGPISEIFVVTNPSELDANGLPPASLTVTPRLTRAIPDATWTLQSSENKAIYDVNIIVLQTNNDDETIEKPETIFDLMKRYFREVKIEYHNKATGIQAFELNNKMLLPAIGLGTGGLGGKNENYRVVKEAVTKHGYAAIDSARAYESEPAIGSLLRENRTLRSGLFLASKVWPTDLYFQATSDAVHSSLDIMKVNYIDLYFIHWPFCYEDLSFMDCSQSKDGKWQQSYEALSKLYGEGLILSIGVSNWDENLMMELLEEYPIKPQVVQNHMDLANFNWELKDFLAQHKILLQAYSTFRGFAEGEEAEYAAWRDTLKVLCDEIQQDQGIKISPSQLALRFMVENEVAVIPRSSKTQHLQENNDIFGFEFTNDYSARLGGRGAKQEL